MTSEDVRGQVSTSLSTKRTQGNDPGIGHRHDRCRNVFAAAFAPNGVVADTGFRQVPHWNSIGEHKANISTVSPLATIRSRTGIGLLLQAKTTKVNTIRSRNWADAYSRNSVGRMKMKATSRVYGWAFSAAENISIFKGLNSF